MRTLIVGCGFLGLAVGRLLCLRGDEVFGLRRSADGSGALKAAGIEPLVGDVMRMTDLNALPGPFDWIVNTVSSSGAATPGVGETSVFVQGTINLLGWLEPE